MRHLQIVWCQIKADVLGIPIALSKAAGGAPFGDVTLVGQGAGLYPDLHSVVRHAVQIQRVFEPDVKRHQRYSEIYELFRDLSQHLREGFIRAAATFAKYHQST